MTLEHGSMAQEGGLVAVREAGRSYLRCPAWGCRWGLELTDLGQFVDLGVSEDGIRRHLASHTPEEWLRTLRIERKERQRWEQTARHAGLCSWCEAPRLECVALWESQRKCCPDCEHAAEPADEVIGLCCAVQAVTEVAVALAETQGTVTPGDRAYLAKQARSHLANVAGDHGKGHGDVPAE